MTKSAEYLAFEAGFLKEAAEAGLDVPFLKGLIAEAEEIQNKWAEFFEEAEKESGDPLFRVKLANEIVMWNIQNPPLNKTAGLSDFLQNPQIMEFFKSIGGQENPGMGGALAGGGGVGDRPADQPQHTAASEDARLTHVRHSGERRDLTTAPRRCPPRSSSSRRTPGSHNRNPAAASRQRFRHPPE